MVFEHFSLKAAIYWIGGHNLSFDKL